MVSLYLVAAGLAVDCVRQAQPAMVHALVDCLGEFVRKTLATWLRRRGGWVSGVLGHRVAEGSGAKGGRTGEVGLLSPGLASCPTSVLTCPSTPNSSSKDLLPGPCTEKAAWGGS